MDVAAVSPPSIVDVAVSTPSTGLGRGLTEARPGGDTAATARALRDLGRVCQVELNCCKQDTRGSPLVIASAAASLSKPSLAQYRGRFSSWFSPGLSLFASCWLVSL